MIKFPYFFDGEVKLKLPKNVSLVFFNRKSNSNFLLNKHFPKKSLACKFYFLVCIT